MYSRSFSDKPPSLPPQYGGTALSGHGERDKDECDEKEREKACKRDEGKQSRFEEKAEHAEGCEGKRPPPPPERGLLTHLLPFDIKGDDLLLLGIALLLLNEGCEDEYLPLLLLFLLIIH